MALTRLLPSVSDMTPFAAVLGRLLMALGRYGCRKGKGRRGGARARKKARATAVTSALCVFLGISFASSTEAAAIFVNGKDISESWIEAAFGPFNSVRHADLTLPYLERALKELPNHKRNRKIFFVNGWLAAFIGGQKSEEALAIVNKFLTDYPDLDRDLRLKILENVDIIERAVKIRTKYP